MAKFNSKWDDHHDYIWPCDCSSSHFLTITWDEQDPSWRCLEISGAYGAERLRDRLRAAIKILRGQSHDNVSIILDERNTREILEALSLHLSAK